MPSTLPYFPFYVDDFCNDQRVVAMTTLEVGTYTFLLCMAWKERPCGTLPADDAVLARWARLSPDQWSEVKPRVMSCFTLRSDGRWHQKRMELEYAKLVALASKRSKAGKRGAEARHGGKRIANAQQTHAIALARGYGSGSLPPPTIALEQEGGAGGTKRILPCDRPDLVPDADAVVAHYHRVVSPRATKAGGREAVLALLVDGKPATRLKAAADGYAWWCANEGIEPPYRNAAKRFYEPGVWEDFVGRSRAAPTKEAFDAALIAQRERLRREDEEEAFRERPADAS